MTTANGCRKQVKSNEKKEEKMNARKVLVLCALVVGLATALEVTALAGPPSREYRPGVNSLYRSYGYNVVPKVNVPTYSVNSYSLPSFYRDWSSTTLARPSTARYVTWNDLLYGDDLPNYVVPVVPQPNYQWSDPLQPGGYDPWDPFGNSFGFAR